jgi:copper resistance protein B
MMKQAGDTARFARADGDDIDSVSFVAGVKLWF